MCFGQVGLEIMAALLKQEGHEVYGLTDSTFDVSNHITNDEKRNLKKIADIKPELVGFSVLSHRYQWCLKFARLIKHNFPKIKIIFGGPHATAVPELVIKDECVDIVCVGEGEEALLELAKNPNSTDIRNMWFKTKKGIIRNPLRPLIKNLDTLPFPDKSIWIDVPKNTFKYYLIMMSRGCPYSCSFCFNSYLHKLYKGLGNYVRFRSVDNVIRELRQAKKDFNIEWVLFMDDNFSLDEKWLVNFSCKYQKLIGLPYACNTHPNTLNKKRITYLKKSGCRFVMVGIQSGSEKVRRKIIGRYETNAKLQEVTKLCHSAKLNFSLDHIFGLDDSITAMTESAQLYNVVRPFTINTYQLYFFPKTPIINYKGLNETDVNKINRGIYQKSTIRSQRYNDYLSFRNLFVLMPLIPQKVVNKIIGNYKLLNMFRRVPEILIWVAKGMNSLLGGNTPSVYTHFKFLPHKIKERLRGYRGEFD